MQKPNLPQVPDIGEVQSRAGVREAVRRLTEYLRNLTQNLTISLSDIASETAVLYAELDWTAALIANGAQTIVTVTVTGAILGYVVNASYDKSLQALQMTASVDSNDTVKILLQNSTGAGVTLADGRFRVYVTPRELT